MTNTTVTDFHCHILPGIDDGSRNLETSLQMLQMEWEQGIRRIVCTPHFYAHRDRVDDFLARRQQAFEQVQEALQKKNPADFPACQMQFRLGAEVAFFQGISRAGQLKELTIEGTKNLLLEMEFCPWDKHVIEELDDITNLGYTIILAHLERYFGFGENKRYIKEMLDMDKVYVQINAETLLDWKSRGKPMKMFRKGQAHLLGSDSHGAHHRIPNLGPGREALAAKLGEDILEEIDERGDRLLT